MPQASMRPASCIAVPLRNRRFTCSVMAAFAISAVLLTVCAPADAQTATVAPNWTQQAPATVPPERSGAGMDYDTATGNLVLFGGSGSTGANLADTWTWNGASWTNVTPASASASPSARQAEGLAYDAATGNLVLFGGSAGAAPDLGDTWTWNGSSWTNVTPGSSNNSPPARQFASMAYDPGHTNVLLFGGDSNRTFQNDTWIWNGTVWTNVTPASASDSPTARFRAAMAYDAATGNVVLFGGMNNTTTFADTWVWNGTVWTKMTPTTTPPARQCASMAFDATTGLLVLFGGIDVNGTGMSDTWLWNGTTWTQASPATAPPTRDRAVMSYDPATENMVLFGGSGGSFNSTPLFDTWTYQTAVVAVTSAVGTAAAQTPVNFLIGTAGTLPALSNANVLTQGASGLDFTLGTGSTCAGAVTAGQTCTINVAFTPRYPGQRQGAVNLFDSNGKLLATAFISGTGTGPLASFSPGVVSTVAGNGAAGYVASQDGGAATSAELNNPSGAAIDGAGNLYIVDSSNSRVREVSAATGKITTFAGNGTAGYVASQDGGIATAAELNYPAAAAVDGAGNVYIADYDNHRVRKVSASTGIITTVAGNGRQGYVASQDGGPATSAELNYPTGVAVDGAGNLYIADEYNQRIREVAAATGIITTVAGNGTQGYVASQDGHAATSAELNYPAGVAVDGSGNLYIAEYGNNRVREVAAATGIITTVAGNGTAGYNRDGIAATGAELNDPYGVTMDGAGNLYIADTGNSRIRKVAAATGIITTVAGNGTAGYVASEDGGASTYAELNDPTGVALDAAGELYIGEFGDNRIRKVTATAAPLSFASTAVGATSSDSPQTVILNNIGTSTLTFANPASGGNPSLSAGFNIGNSSTCPQLTQNSSAGTLAPGASCSDLISFLPVASGSIRGSLTTTDDTLNATGSTQAVSLSGTATPDAFLVTGVSPNNGAPAGGTSVTITGTGLSNVTSVTFGGVAATSFTVVSSTQITAVSPAGSVGSVDIIVGSATDVSEPTSADQYTYAVPVPTITSLSPTNGTTAGGTTVTITGTNFTGTTAVTFGGVPVTSFTVVSATQLTVKTPAGIAGAVAVVVTTPYGSVTSPGGYTYEAPPTVTGVSPARGSVNGGTMVTITGTGFTPMSTVLFGSAAPTSPIHYTSSSSILAVSPAQGVGTVDVVVSDGNASSAVSSLDQYTYGIPVPTLAVSHTGNAVAGGNLSYTVTAGVTGTTAEMGELTLASSLPMGVSFVSSSGSAWQCSGVYGGLSCNNRSSIAPGGSYPLSITLGFNSCASAGIAFSLADAHNSYVNAVDPTNVTCPTPTATGITPATGPAAGGNAVTITGTNFFAGATVSIGAQAATNVMVANSTTLTATVPAYMSGAATTNVTVATAGGNGLLANGYTYTFPMPTTTSITPNSGPTAGGTLVTLSGTNLSYVQSVTFGTTAAVIDSDSATSIVVTAPAHAAAGAVSINLTFPTGVVGIAGGYTYVPSQLVVTSAADDGTAVAANCTPQAVAGTGTDANCRLRDAVAVANANPGSTITFDATKFATQQTITLASTLAFTASMTIHGPGQTLLSVSGGNAVRIATIASGINVAIDSMTLTLGETTSLGGAVDNNEGTFSATLVTFSNNAAAQGGAIMNGNNELNGTSGTVRIDQCTFLNNTASQVAGAIENFGTLRVTNSTFSNNSAVIEDSAISSFGVALTVINSTFTNNSGPSSAASAAVDSEDTTVTVVNNTFSGNSGGGTGTPDLSVDAPTRTVNNNLFLEGTSTQFAGGIGNVLGSTLTPLANYGGSTQTMLPVPGSAAICAGSVANIFAGSTTDQRGLARTTTYGANAACVDAGAVQTHYAASWNPQPTNVLVGATMTPAPTVTITESGIGYAGIGTALGLGTAGPTLSGGTATTIASGAATYSALSLNQGVTGETLLLPISIANGFAYSVASAAFNVTVPVPTLTSVNPASGSTAGGNAVTLTGTNLTGATSVTIGGVAATLGANTGTTLVVMVPAYVSGALTKNVVLTAPGGSVSLTNAYTYTAVTPAIVGVTPNNGPVAGGTLVTITGTGFTPGTTVSFGSSGGGAVTVVNSTTLTVTTPAYVSGSLAVNVVVNNGAGSATLLNGYTYVAIVPAVTDVMPNGGPALGGTTVTISGTNFLSGTTVSFGGVAATRVTVVSASSITAVSPAGTGLVDVTVTSGGQTSVTGSGDRFAYAADTITAAATNVGSTSASYQVTFVFTVATTLSSTASTAVKVLTQGATGLDFTQASGGSCTAGATYQAGDSCTVQWTLHPYAPGLRVGAIELLNTSGAIVSSQLVSGVGVGPLASVDPAVISTVVPGSNITNLGIGVDAQGNIYYYNGDAGALFEVAAGTNVSTRIYTTSDTVRHVAADGAGNLYLAGSAVIVKLAAGTFTPTTLATGISTSQGIVVDAAGNVYAGDSGHTRVIEMPASNQVCGAACPTVGSGFADVRGLAMSSTGTIYVAERSAQRVSQVIGGVRSNFLTGLTNGPDELMVDGGDAVYVFFNSEDTQKYSAAGALLQDLLTTIGSAGAPSDLAMDGLGNIYSAVGGSGEHGEVAKYTRTALAGFTPTVNFGGVAAGTTSAAMTVALSNSGNSTLSAVAPGIAVAPTDFVSVTTGTGVCGPTFSLAAGAVCQLSAEFGPATTDTGAKTGAETITDNSLNASPSAMQSVTLTGTALAPPASTSLTPASGPIAGGTLVMIMGTNFTGATSVTFGGAAATLGTVTATSIMVMTPAHAAGAVGVAITTPGGTTTLPAAYTYIGASNVSVTPVTVTYGSATANLSATYTYVAGYPPTNGFIFTIGTGTVVAGSCSATSATSEACTATYPVAGLSVVGSPYVITGSLAADTNYPASSATASLTVTKATATVTFISSTLSQTYTGSALSASATVAPPSIPASELSYTYAGTGSTAYPSSTTPPTNVGTYAVSASLTDANYTGSAGPVSFTITPAMLTATAGSYSGVYDGNTHALSACIVTSNPGGIGCTNSPVGPVGPDVSSGLVAPVITGAASNYLVLAVAGSYSITQGSSTTTLTCPASVPYTGTAQTPCTATVTGAGGLSQSTAVIYTLNTNVGTATATATFSGDANHTASNRSTTFTIVAATLTATAGSYSGVYDGNTHALSACAVSSNAGGLTCTNNPVGPVGADVSSGVVVPVISGSTGNYTITAVNGAYSITQAPSTTTLSCPASVIYNGTAQTPCTATVTGAGGLIQSLTVVYTLNTNVGTATASATFSGDTNHTSSSKSTTFNITAATLTAVAGSYSGVYDGGTHALSACVVSSNPGGLTCTNSPAGPVGPDVGSAVVMPVLSGPAGNYSVTMNNGSWSITALPVTVTAGSYNGTYDGASHATAACTSSYLGVRCTNTPASIGPGLSSGSVTAVVSYTTGMATDYTITALKGSYSIAAASASVTPNAAGKLYGTADPALTGTLSGFAPADGVTATYSRVPGELVAGSPYTISAVLSPAAVLSNYSITYNHAAFTISKAPVIVSLSASSQQANPYQSVTLYSTVASTTTGTPTGSVTFMNNGSILETVPLLNGSASYSTSALTPAQVAVITVSYSGDKNYVAGAGGSSVGIAVGALDFTFSTTGYSSYSVAPGLVANYNFAVAPLFTNYAGPVSFSVTGLPAGATATFTPSSVSAGGGSQAIVMSVQTRSAMARNEGHGPLERTLPMLALLFLPLLGNRRLRKKMNPRMLTVLLLLSGLGGAAALTGCGAGSGFLLEAPSSYTLNVTATAGTIQHSQTITLIVQ